MYKSFAQAIGDLDGRDYTVAELLDKVKEVSGKVPGAGPESKNLLWAGTFPGSKSYAGSIIGDLSKAGAGFVVTLAYSSVS